MNIQGKHLQAILDAVLEDSNNMQLNFGNIVKYNQHMRYRYLHTLKDVLPLGTEMRILEIGAFTGVVSSTLSDLGHTVVAHDIPFIIDDPGLAGFFEKRNIQRIGLDLADTNFDLESESFDLVIFNEVIEHLNFNSIPLLKEFARLLSPGGLVYCATPNLAFLKNRIYMMQGKGYLNPIDDFVRQLKPNSDSSIGLHWREWNKQELVALFTTSGFELERHWYRLHVENTSSLIRRTLVGRLYSMFPALKPGQVGLFKKL